MPRFLFLLLLTHAALAAARAQPAIHVASGVTLPDSARVVLTEILEAAGVPSARVTSAYRAPAEQVRVMDGYIRRNGAAQARALYGPEGDAVVAVWERYRSAPEPQRLIEMEAELRRQLPSAFANKRLMHLNPCYFTFDVSMRSVPATRHAAFIAAAERHPGVHRFLGPGQGEREAFHIEVPRPAPCTIAAP